MYTYRILESVDAGNVSKEYKLALATVGALQEEVSVHVCVCVCVCMHVYVYE